MWSLLLLSFIVAATIAAEDVACSVCRDGSSVAIPEKMVDIPGVPGPYSCEALDGLLPVLYSSNSPECTAMQSIGAICGCPTPANSCSLCEGGAMPSAPKRPLPFFAGLVNQPNSTLEIVPNCESTDAYMRTTQSSDSATCKSSRASLAEYCQCSGGGTVDDDDDLPCSLCQDGSPVAFSEQDLGIIDFPFITCSLLEEGVATLFKSGSEQCIEMQDLAATCGCPLRENHCQLCPDGSSISVPDKLVPFLTEQYNGFVPTCKAYESYTQSVDKDDDLCSVIQLTASFCGCPPVDDPCQATKGEILKPEFALEIWPDELDDMYGSGSHDHFAPTCLLTEYAKEQIDNDDIRCFMLKTRGDICGFNNGEMIYAGAKNEREKIAISTLPRISGILSLIGAAAIIIDVCRCKKKRRQIYTQLMASMSLFDVLSSFGWIAASSANPADDIWPVYGERGNEATCKAQAFFIMLSTVTLMYNVSLMMYYYMSIRLEWRGDKLKTTAKYLHILPAVSFIMAFAGIPFYGTVLVFCHVSIPPMADSWVPVIWFQVVPGVFGIVVCSMLTFAVWFKVHRQVLTMHKWTFRATSGLKDAKTRRSSLIMKDASTRSIFQSSLSSSTGNHGSNKTTTMSTIQKVEREVLWQGIVYMIAFYVSWVSNTIYIRTRAKSYRLTCIVLILVPLQGALNSLNYFRPRVFRYLQQRRKRNQQRTSESLKANDNFVGYTDQKVVASNENHGSISPLDSSTDRMGASSSPNRHCTLDEYDAIEDPCAFLEAQVVTDGHSMEEEEGALAVIAEEEPADQFEGQDEAKYEDAN